VEAETRDFRARGFARLQQRVLRRDVDLFAVDNKLGHVFLLQVIQFGVVANSSFPMLVLAAPIFPLGGHPGRVVPGVVGQIADQWRRRMPPALPEQRLLAARLFARCLGIWPPELAIMASQIPVFPRHGVAPRVAPSLFRRLAHRAVGVGIA
jgi:hypothetical protein